MYNDWVYALQKYTQKQKVSKLKPRGKNGRLVCATFWVLDWLGLEWDYVLENNKKFKEAKAKKNKISLRKTMLKNISKQ